MKYLCYFMCLWLLCAPGMISAQIDDLDQQVFASAGDAAQGGGVHLSWTIGEAIVTTESGGSLILQQGFQQGLDDHFAGWRVGLDEAVLATPVSVYPNPAETHVWVEAGAAATLQVRVMNAQGQLVFSVERQFSDGERVQIPTTTWAEGSYFLAITSPGHDGSHTLTILKQ